MAAKEKQVFEPSGNLTKDLQEKEFPMQLLYSASSHAIDLHVGQSRTDMVSRLLKERMRHQPGNKQIYAASTYRDKKTAEAVIKQAIFRKTTDIDAWVRNKSDGQNFSFSFTSQKDIGKGFMPDFTEYKTTVSRIVLQKDPAMPYGFSVKTAYPLIDPRTQGVTRTGKDGKDILPKLTDYHNASPMVRAYLDNIVQRRDLSTVFDTRSNTIYVNAVDQSNPNTLHSFSIGERYVRFYSQIKQADGSFRRIESPFRTQRALANGEGYISHFYPREADLSGMRANIPEAMDIVDDIMTKLGTESRFRQLADAPTKKQGNTPDKTPDL